jgi:N-acetylglucosamine malate deacetylase 1
MGTERTVKRVLAVGAHPDDIEILCGGTLAKYAQQGVKVSMAVATDGAAGHMVIPPKELAEIRRREAEKSAKVIGADFYWLGFGDERIFEDLATRMVFVELIRKAKPDVIITHNPGDYHPDNKTVSRLMFDASFTSGLKNIETETPFHPGVQPLIYMDTVNGANFIPTEFVDVGESFALKQQMLRCFESQVKWLRDHDNVDFLFMVEVATRSRGYQCGVEFAEAFGSENVWPRSRPFRLLP